MSRPKSEPAVAASPKDSRAPRSHPHRRGILLIIFLSIGALVAGVIAAGIGQVHIPPLEVLGSVLNRIGVDIGAMPSHPQGERSEHTSELQSRGHLVCRLLLEK